MYACLGAVFVVCVCFVSVYVSGRGSTAQRVFYLDFSGDIAAATRSLPRHTVFEGLVHAHVFMCVAFCVPAIKPQCVHEFVSGFSVCVRTTEFMQHRMRACQYTTKCVAFVCVCQLCVWIHASVCVYRYLTMCLMQGRLHIGVQYSVFVCMGMHANGYMYVTRFVRVCNVCVTVCLSFFLHMCTSPSAWHYLRCGEGERCHVICCMQYYMSVCT
jgi:hypothetical protein